MYQFQSGSRTSVSARSARTDLSALEEVREIDVDQETQFEYYNALEAVSPRLKGSDPDSVPDILKEGNAIVVLLETTKSPVEFRDHEFVSAAKLQQHLKRPSVVTDRKRVYIVESLSPDYVSVLGQHFAVHPEFFQQHQLHLRNESHSYDNDNPLKPQDHRRHSNSWYQSDDGSFHLQYCELRQFDRIIDNLPFVCPRTGRAVDIISRHANSGEGASSTTAVLRRKVSWWSRSLPNGAWDAIILCDPPLTDVAPDDRIVDYITLQNVPYQGGYNDFMPCIDSRTALKAIRHPQHSMRADLCYYFRHRTTHFSDQEWLDPCTSSFFIRKIAAVQYCRVAQHITVMLPALQPRFYPGWSEEKEHWELLQSMALRCGTYKEDIVDSLRSLGFRPVIPQCMRPRPNDCNWRDCEIDFHYVYYRLEALEQRICSLLDSMAGLSAIAGGNQSLEGATRVRKLHLLLLLFGSLTLTSKLFGVQPDFLPSRARWPAFAISASGSVVVMICLVGIWSWAQHKSLTRGRHRLTN